MSGISLTVSDFDQMGTSCLLWVSGWVEFVFVYGSLPVCRSLLVVVPFLSGSRYVGG